MPNPYIEQVDVGGTRYDIHDTEIANKQDKTDNSLTTTDKTIVGAINEHESDIGTINTSLSNKQDKLTNPLTQSDVINNLTSTATNKPLSAAQGKALNTNKANIGALATKTGGNHAFSYKWTNDSYIEIYVDNTLVCQIKGFKKYD